MRELTKSETIKALTSCAVDGNCTNCPLLEDSFAKESCVRHLMIQALAQICIGELQKEGVPHD